MTRSDVSDEELAKLVERVREATGALMQGDVRRYLGLVNHAPDYTLMPPTGGPTRHGFGASPAGVEGWRRAYEGRTVILSIRPEDLEDAALASDTPSDRRLHGNVVLREGLGSEIVAHFDIDARPALTDDVRELAADVGEELTVQAPHTRMVGRFGAGSAVHGDQEAEVAVDTRALHFFDPDTGAGIYDTDSRRS